MIYFLVNNDYQLFDARQHLSELEEKSIAASLIEVPHYLNSPDRDRGFAEVLRFASPLKAHRWGGAWLRYFASWWKVVRTLKPSAEDVLFLYTEFELLNHFIARRFKRSGAKIYLVEDGGFGTYVPLSLAGGEALTKKEAIVAAMSRLLPGLGATVFHKANGVVFPWLPDTYLDGLCVYRPVSIVRQIPIKLLKRPAPYKPVDRIEGRVIFLNERMYDVYQNSQQYFDGLERIVEGLTRGFDEVIFKFHPSETAEWRRRISAFLEERAHSVQILEDDTNIEGLLGDYRPEVLASYFSTALLNLEGSGVEPMYLYHLIDAVAAQKVFLLVSALLRQWNYNFADYEDGICSGYRSGLAADANVQNMSIADLAESIQ